MRKYLIGIIIALTCLTTVSQGQLAEYDFFVESVAGNGYSGNNATGVAIEGTVTVFDTYLEIFIRNLSGGLKDGGPDSYTKGDMVGFAFMDPFDTDPGNDTFELWDTGTPFLTGWSIIGDDNSYYKPTNSLAASGADVLNDAGETGAGIDWVGEVGGITEGTWRFTPNGAAIGEMEQLADLWDNNGTEFDMFARFQSVQSENGGSDKVGFTLTKVPEPSTYGLIGAGALVLLIAARKFKKVA